MLAEESEMAVLESLNHSFKTAEYTNKPRGAGSIISSFYWLEKANSSIKLAKYLNDTYPETFAGTSFDNVYASFLDFERTLSRFNRDLLNNDMHQNHVLSDYQVFTFALETLESQL
jgi:hypothetical protein